MRFASAALLLVACAEPTVITRPDTGPRPMLDGGEPIDAGPSWAQLGCELVPWCLSHGDGWGSRVRLCPSSLEAYALMRDSGEPILASCAHWMVCGDCWTCRDWSSHPTALTAPDVAESEPACSMPLCSPRFEGDAGPNDAGPSPYALVCNDAGL